VKLLVTEKWLAEQKRLNTFEAFMKSHLDDCLQVRRENSEALLQLEQKVDDNHTEWKQIVQEQHKSNTSSLRWIIGILIAMLLSVVGYLGAKVLDRSFPAEPASAASHSLGPTGSSDTLPNFSHTIPF